MKNILRLIRRVTLRLAAFFFGTTILAVVAYGFVPVYVTPLMVIRGIEKISQGSSPMWHHQWVSIDEMSSHMPVAVMASEDQRFLLHHGFDYAAIESAAKRNRESGKQKYGASTITQQTVKNAFLWPGRSWVRKGLEAYFTVLTELLWSKQRIMEVYLNSIEMGDGIYGLQAVARHHFDKDAEELSRSECALIAATLPNPRRFSSNDPSAYMRKRQRQIEQQMKFIPSFPKEGESVNPNTVSGGIYKKKK